MLSLVVGLLLLLAPDTRAQTEGGPPRAPYRVGVLTDNYPFSFADPGGEPRGFAVDLLREIESTMGLRLERVVGSTAEINSAFEDGRLDMLQSYVPNEDRRRFADFSLPYVEMTGAIFVRRGTREISRLTDLHGRRVMVHERSQGAEVLRHNGLGDSIVTVGSVEEGFRLLAAGSNDATLAARLTGLAAVERLGIQNVAPVGQPIHGYDVSYSFAVRKECPELLTQINEGLRILAPAGTTQRIHEAWFGRFDPTTFSTTDIAFAVSIGLAIALIIAIRAMMHQRRLRQHITRQAADLRSSEEGYRAVFDSTIDGLFVFEIPAQPGDRWTVLQLNPAARRILGEPAKATPPATFHELFPAEAALASRITSALSKTDPLPFEHDRTRDNVAAWVHVSITSLRGDRRLLVLRDVTETHVAAERLSRSEAQLRQNQKLEAIGTLASGIAHDFNNILAAILGNADLMRLDLAPDHAAAPALQEIRQAAERARFLVRQILAFSRQAESHRQVIQATSVIRETLRFVSAAAPSTVEFHHSKGDGSPEIEIDPTQLHQVLMNLCTNAVHALGNRGGRIEIIECAATVTAGTNGHPQELKPGEYLVITVRDTGTGMPPEVLQRIFEPFYTTKPSGEGTGLGLAVVHGIVHACGGAIAVSSTPRLGTTFQMYFPAAAGPATMPANESAEVPRGCGQTILFVDDEPAIAKAATRMLERLGYSVTAFSRPADALAELHRRNGPFDLVVTDLNMPGMNGIELATRVRQLAPTVPIILMSGFINERQTALARAERIAPILEKPLTLEALGRAVASCLPAPR